MFRKDRRVIVKPKSTSIPNRNINKTDKTDQQRTSIQALFASSADHTRELPQYVRIPNNRASENITSLIPTLDLNRIDLGANEKDIFDKMSNRRNNNSDNGNYAPMLSQEYLEELKMKYPDNWQEVVLSNSRKQENRRRKSTGQIPSNNTLEANIEVDFKEVTITRNKEIKVEKEIASERKIISAKKITNEKEMSITDKKYKLTQLKNELADKKKYSSGNRLMGRQYTHRDILTLHMKLKKFGLHTSEQDCEKIYTEVLELINKNSSNNSFNDINTIINEDIKHYKNNYGQYKLS